MGFFGRKKFEVDDTPEPETTVVEPRSANEVSRSASARNSMRTGDKNSGRGNQAALPAPTPAYGVNDAIELMRTLPSNNVELVVQVVLHTLRSMDIEVSDIIVDADKKQKTLRERVATLQEEIVDFKAKIASREEEIRGLEADHDETGIVKDRLTLAQQLVTNAPPSSAPLTVPSPAATPAAATPAAAAPVPVKSALSSSTTSTSTSSSSTSSAGLLGGSSTSSSAISRPALGSSLKAPRKPVSSRIGRSSSTSKSKMPVVKAPPSSRQPTPPRPSVKGTMDMPVSKGAPKAKASEPLFGSSEPEFSIPEASPDLDFGAPEPTFDEPAPLDALVENSIADDPKTGDEDSTASDVEVAAEIEFPAPGDGEDGEDGEEVSDLLVLSTEDSEPDDETAIAAIEAAAKTNADADADADKADTGRGKSKGKGRKRSNKKKS